MRPTYVMFSASILCVCFSVVDHFHNRRHFFIDKPLTWSEASDECRKTNDGYLAVANSEEEFDFLRGMYDEYVAQGGSAIGVWIDGTFDNDTKTWTCYSNYDDVYFDDSCLDDMPWSFGEPNRNETEHCILVWYSRTDGVANYRCNVKLPAICATKRYFFVPL